MMMNSFARNLRGSPGKNHEFKIFRSKIYKKTLERSLEITWSHSQRNLHSAIDNEAASVVDGKKIIFLIGEEYLETNITHSA